MKINTINKFILDLFKNPSSFLELKKWYYYYKRKDIKTPLDYKIPWMTFGAIEYLSDYLQQNMEVFEYGSGGSTLFFSNKVKKIVSIEHDRNWYDYEINVLSKLKNLELNLVLPEDTGRLKNYRKNYNNKFFDNYVNIIDNYEEFDVIIVDGRQRNDCFKKAIKHIKKNGIIIFDNFDREYYQKSLKYINKNDFDIMNFHGFVPFGTMQSLTTILKRK